MALDATVGGENANSFGTRSEAIAYFTEHPFGADFLLLTGTAQDALLIHATSLLTTLCWTGAAASETQALPWPRTGMKSVTGYSLASDSIPRQLKEMTFELANRLRTANVASPSAAAEAGLTRIKAGDVDLEFREEITYSAVPADIKARGVASWFCSTSPGFMFEVL